MLRPTALAVCTALAATLLAPAGARAAEPTRVLVTAFEPFGGREINNSARIAEALQNAKAVYGPDVEIELCILPVVYDAGAAKAKDCYEKMAVKPDAVISLGEAGCDLRLETAAHNEDDTPGFPDNAGNVRDGKPILANGPKSIGFDLPVQQMFCALDAGAQDAADVSKTPGGFVCNNTAYLLANYFKGTGVRYGFVHVPAASCSDEAADPAANGARLAGMIRGMAEHDTGNVSTDVVPHCSNDTRLPTDSQTIANILDSLREGSAKECEKRFLEELKKRL